MHLEQWLHEHGTSITPAVVHAALEAGKYESEELGPIVRTAGRPYSSHFDHFYRSGWSNHSTYCFALQRRKVGEPAAGESREPARKLLWTPESDELAQDPNNHRNEEV